ncbi:MAG: suppressor of fused domain protein [Acidobacteria bacterium]|nr:suppressor of fused domain protein [Acidobacteriota bacterium]
MNASVRSSVKAHITDFWPKRECVEEVLGHGPIQESLRGFCVLRLKPTDKTEPWVYCTLGSFLAGTTEHVKHEFFLLSPAEDQTHVETLTMLANFHADDRYRLTVGSVVNIGGPWLDESDCDHLLISLPYPFGPKLEWLKTGGFCVQFLWALPITAREAAFSELNGSEALEQRFDAAGINYLDPKRPSLA